MLTILKTIWKLGNLFLYGLTFNFEKTGHFYETKMLKLAIFLDRNAEETRRLMVKKLVKALKKLQKLDDVLYHHPM